MSAFAFLFAVSLGVTVQDADLFPGTTGASDSISVRTEPIDAQEALWSLHADTLTLRQAMVEAISRHPSLVASEERLNSAEAQVLRARAELRPRLILEAEAVRYEFPMVVAPLHGFDPGSPPDFSRSLFRSRAQASWTLTDGGVARATVEQRSTFRNAAVMDLAQTEADLLAHTASSYLDVLVHREILAAERERFTALTSEVERVERFAAEGRASRLERLRASAALEEGKAGLASAVARLKMAQRVLARLLGRPLEGVSEAKLVWPSFEPLVEGGSETQPHELSAAANRLRAAEAALVGVSATRRPRLDVLVGLAQFGGSGSAFTSEWDVGLRLSWPLFAGGGRRAEAAAAAARVREARGTLEALELTLADAEDAALVAGTEARARRAALAAAVESLAEVVRIEVLALDTGTGVQRDFLSAQADLVEARAEMARAEAAAFLSWINLERVRGALNLDDLLVTLEEFE